MKRHVRLAMFSAAMAVVAMGAIGTSANAQTMQTRAPADSASYRSRDGVHIYAGGVRRTPQRGWDYTCHNLPYLMNRFACDAK